MTKDFFKIAYSSNTVICCRVSPSQKRQIIQKIKKIDKNAITLAIGDGNNDVSMITEANIGVGIHGEEGMSAVQASDFAIGEFQLLKRLLFVHGRNNLFRINEMIIYFFYKNFIFSFCQFYYSTRCLASGQTLIDDWFITCYNLIFTSIPLGVKALTDSDIDLNDKKNMKKNLSFLYKENRDNNKTFTFKTLILDLLKGIFFSLIFCFCGFDNEILIHGYNKNMSYISLKIYISIIIVVSMNLLIQSHFIAYLLPLTIGITTFLLLVFLLLNHYGLFFNYNSKASLFVPITSSQFILGIVFIGCLNFVFEYSLKLFRTYFDKSLSLKLVLKRSSIKRKRMKSFLAFKRSLNLPNNKENLKLSFISRMSSFNKIFDIKNSNKSFIKTKISK
jgi:magnesium-transporting ATPase (P-type)